MRQQVEFRLRQAMEELSVSIADFARELHINADQVSRLRAGTWTSITQEEVQRILLWGKKHGVNDLIAYVPHAIWSTFADADVTIFIGGGATDEVQDLDVRASEELARSLREDGSHPGLRQLKLLEIGESTDHFVEDIRDQMRTRNCIFLGGPRQNPASEVAIASLWPATPFKRDEVAAQRVPFEFTYPSWPEGKAQSSFALAGSNSREIRLKVGAPKTLRVPYRTDEDWVKFTGLAWDFGLAAICRRPLESTANVTTVVIAGLGGLATWATTCGLTRGSLHLPSTEVEDGRAIFRIMCARFRKKLGPDNRTWMPSSSKWAGPPWRKWPPRVTR